MYHIFDTPSSIIFN